MEIEEPCDYEFMYKLQCELTQKLEYELKMLKEKKESIERELIDAYDSMLELQEEIKELKE